jgi:crotonobetainyl-CoA:carnitine CoA-transferase CaiB-like acyl-CoA transferase
VFHAGDRELVIAVGNDKQFRALAGVLGNALADDPRFATNADRVAHRDELTAFIEQRLAGASASHWVAALTAVGVPAGLVNDVHEAIRFAEGLGLEPVAEIPTATHPSRTVANPIGLTADPAAYRTAPPALDAHSGADWLETSAPRKESR